MHKSFTSLVKFVSKYILFKKIFIYICGCAGTLLLCIVVVTCLLRNLYAGQEATVRTENGTTDWFKSGKEYDKTVYHHPAYLTYLQNIRLDEAQAGIKIARRNISNLRYADDTTLMAESEEELKILLIKVKEKSENLAQTSTFKILKS